MRIDKMILGLALTVVGSTSVFGQFQTVPEAEFINILKSKGADNTFSWDLPENSLSIDLASFAVVDQKIATHGKILGEENSNVMFKVNGQNVYGYILNITSNEGYLFESNDKGLVEISEVESEEFYHITHFENKKTRKLAEEAKPFANVQSAEYPHIQPYVPNMDMHSLESKPGSPNVIFLDWRDVFNGNVPKNLTSEEMYHVWAGTAAGYISFDVNVTTSPSVYNSVPVTNSCIALFKDHDARSHAPADSWGTANSSTIYTANQTDWYVNTLVHEIGHQLGLDHDGAPHNEYFKGVAEYDWNSIMGHTWYANFLQYSKGEYRDANNQEDDFAVINRYIPYRNDDVPNTKNIGFSQDNQTVPLQNNIGNIGLNTDEDVYTFSVTEPKILNLLVEPLEFRTMLDVDARLVAPNGQVIAQSNVEQVRIGEFKDLLLEDLGTYKLIIKGGAEGTPEWGFSNYSSVGVYGFSGSIRNLHDEEVSVLEVMPFEEVCNSYAPTVEVKNLGKQTINSLELEVKVGNNAPTFVTVGGLNIPSIGEADVQLDKISQVGNDIPLKISVSKVNGNVPTVTNDFEVNYTLGQGVNLELNINAKAYPFTQWHIESSNGTELLNYSDVIAEVNTPNENKMRFCLAEDCYQLKVSHELESCSNIESWSGGTYSGGDIVTHQATDANGHLITYSAKWWATGSNVPGGGDPWEEVGICTGADRGAFSLKVIGDNKNLVESSSATGTDDQSFEFCPATITSSNEIMNNNLSVFPNPFKDNITVQLSNETILLVQVFDVNGREVVRKQGNNTSLMTLGMEVPKGVYLVKIKGENGFYSSLVIK